MFPDPAKLDQLKPTEVLDAAAAGHLGLDHRFLHALTDRSSEALPATLAFAARDRSQDKVDLTPELVALCHYWRSSEAVPFLIGIIRDDPENTPDEVIEALVAIGRPALEPLLALYDELDESQSGEAGFILASLSVRDERILEKLVARLEYDASDGLLLLGVYGDPAAIPAIEKLSADLDPSETEMHKELRGALELLGSPAEKTDEKDEPFDVWALYPECEDLPVDFLDEDERLDLLSHPVPSVRAAAAQSFFNQELTVEQRTALLDRARRDDSDAVRARSWEALINSTEDTDVVEAMLVALRKTDLSIEEQGGLLVGLAPEADRNEVQQAILRLYEAPGGRAKALEAMWRSMRPSFRDHFARHMDDSDLEVRRSAIWGVGYYGLKSELEKLRTLFSDEELRSDALFAYALALPAELSRGRLKSVLARIERDAHGLSEMEEELVKTALDERLMLAGKEPVFRAQED